MLPAIQAPTLVFHLRDNPLVPLAAGRKVAALIPGARFVEAPGTDVYPWPGADDPEMDLVEEFLTGRRQPRASERVLATVMFTDIVASTDHAAQFGDRVGTSCWIATTSSSAPVWTVTVATRSRPSETASSQPLTGRPAQSGARERSSTRFRG